MNNFSDKWKIKENPNKFAQKLDYVFKLGIIDTEHYENLTIFNRIRNLYAHNIHPHDEAIELIQKFPSYEEIKKILESIKKFPSDEILQKYHEILEKLPNYNEMKKSIKFLDNHMPSMITAGVFGLISFLLTCYLFIVFLNPNIAQ